MEGLARHGRTRKILEGTGELVEGSQPRHHAAEKRLEETGGGELGGFADHQIGFVGDGIQIRQREKRTCGTCAFEHFDFDRPSGRSSHFSRNPRFISLEIKELHLRLTRMGSFVEPIKLSAGKGGMVKMVENWDIFKAMKRHRRFNLSDLSPLPSADYQRV